MINAQTVLFYPELIHSYPKDAMEREIVGSASASLVFGNSGKRGSKISFFDPFNGSRHTAIFVNNM